MCALVCDKHGQVCTIFVPDGIHERRMHRQKASQLMEYRNGWRIGWTLTLDGPWQYCAPGHPTKSANEIWTEQWKASFKPVPLFKLIADEIQSNGGGI